MNLDAAILYRRARTSLLNTGSSLRRRRSSRSADETKAGETGASPGPPRHRKRYARWLVTALVVVLIVAGIGVILIATQWPFTEKAVLADLQGRIADTVKIGSFRAHYFPYPGCVAENVTFQRNAGPSGPPLMQIQKLTIRSTFAGLLARHVSEIRADGLRLRIVRRGLKPKTSGSGGVTIGRIVINDGIVEFEPHRSGGKAQSFNIYHSEFTPSTRFDRMGFSARLRIPQPPGELAVNGSVGPWKKEQPDQTPLAGSYTLEHANLGAFTGVAGTLSSEGKFNGVLQRVEVQGTTDMPDFEITDPGHPMPLSTRFSAVVNGKNGDVFLQSVQARLRRTSIDAQGSIAPASGSQEKSTGKSPSGKQNAPGTGGKTASFEMTGTGRIEDLLWLFTKAKPPRMLGALNFRAKVSLPPGPVRFIRKLSLRGDFEIASASFTNPRTQHGLEELSPGIKADQDPKDTPRVLADLKSQVALRDGLTTFTKLSMTVPGASADFGGVYSFLSEKIDMQGTLRTEKPLSQTTTGVKSVLLKFIGRFFKKQRHFEVPVRIGGNYQNPTFGVVLGSKNSNK